MKHFVASCLFLLFGNLVNAQSFEGRLVYRETVSGAERQVTMHVAPKQALIKRGEDNALYYLVNATERGFSAWQAGASKTDVGQLTAVVKPAKVMPSSNQEQIIAGFKARQIRYDLPDGSRFEGWYTTDLSFQHNAFVHRLLGHEWGWLPADGVLLRWQFTDAKGRSLVSGELTAHQPGKQDPKLFVPLAATNR